LGYLLALEILQPHRSEIISDPAFLSISLESLRKYLNITGSRFQDQDPGIQILFPCFLVLSNPDFLLTTLLIAPLTLDSSDPALSVAAGIES
jgi:hypothetical protein